MLLAVWIVVAVLAVLLLGAIGFGVLGALQRLTRELRGLERDLRPVRADLQATALRITAQRADEGTASAR